MNSSIKDAITMRALIEVDNLYALEENRSDGKIKLNVIGGFALMLNNIRKDMTEYTDIDYVGGELPENLQKIIKNVGIKHGLDVNWINNDALLEGSSLEDLEITTGKLNFAPTKVELNCFEVHSLCNQDLIRLKMMAIDTTYMTLEAGETFTRMKDFSDVKLLMEQLNIDIPALKKMTSDYVLEPVVYDIVDMYNKTGEVVIESVVN
ncbi:MAG: hypothetical protein FWC89_04995 [Defluviitaleaceae bacterium]|nr:hypothetical protein [Defluviitaleaceae bacterium]